MDGNGRVLGELEGPDKEVPEVDDSSTRELYGSDASQSALDRRRIEIEGSNVSAELEGDTLVMVAESARAIEAAELATSKDCILLLPTGNKREAFTEGLGHYGQA